nr:hypothetical protein OG781_31475 [Streptomyces sp. NBC_00830]
MLEAGPGQAAVAGPAEAGDVEGLVDGAFDPGAKCALSEVDWRRIFAEPWKHACHQALFQDGRVDGGSGGGGVARRPDPSAEDAAATADEHHCRGGDDHVARSVGYDFAGE